MTTDTPIEMVLHCPECRARHIDVGEFATKPHRTHACQNCGMVWRPAIGPTVGVQFLPGFKNASGIEAASAVSEPVCSKCHQAWATHSLKPCTVAAPSESAPAEEPCPRCSGLAVGGKPGCPACATRFASVRTFRAADAQAEARYSDSTCDALTNEHCTFANPLLCRRHRDETMRPMNPLAAPADPQPMETDEKYRGRIMNKYGMWGAFGTVVIESSGKRLDEVGEGIGVKRQGAQPEALSVPMDALEIVTTHGARRCANCDGIIMPGRAYLKRQRGTAFQHLTCPTTEKEGERT